METWDLAGLDVKPHQPEVIESDSEGRAIVIELPAGEALTDHRVHERAWLLVVRGTVEVHDSTSQTVSGGPGLLATFDPNERREVRAKDDARLLLLLSPWPGVGHPRRGDGYPPASAARSRSKPG